MAKTIAELASPYTTTIKPSAPVVKKPIVPVKDLTINKAIRKTSQYPNIPVPTANYNYTKGTYTTFDYIKDNLSSIKYKGDITEHGETPIQKIAEKTKDVAKKTGEVIKDVFDKVKDIPANVEKGFDKSYIIVGIGVILFAMFSFRKK